MEELSLNVLDIAENSVSANATVIEIIIEYSEKKDMISIEIKDNGKGMAPEFLEKVTDPFTTTRTTRKVGLGLPFFKMGALMCDGSFNIDSKVGVGTTVKASYRYSHIDRAPLGDIGSTISSLMGINEHINFIYTVIKNDVTEFQISTEDIKKVLDGVPINNSETLIFLRDMINENTNL